MDGVTQVGVGGIFVMMVLKEVSGMLKSRNGNGAAPTRDIQLQVLSTLKDVVQAQRELTNAVADMKAEVRVLAAKD